MVLKMKGRKSGVGGAVILFPACVILLPKMVLNHEFFNCTNDRALRISGTASSRAIVLTLFLFDEFQEKPRPLSSNLALKDLN